MMDEKFVSRFTNNVLDCRLPDAPIASYVWAPDGSTDLKIRLEGYVIVPLERFADLAKNEDFLSIVSQKAREWSAHKSASRLRDSAPAGTFEPSEMREAADEIERLQRELKLALQSADQMKDAWNAACDDISKLKTAHEPRAGKPGDLQSLCGRLADVFNTDDTPDELSTEAREAIEHLWKSRDNWMQWAQHLAACTDCHVGDTCRDGVALRAAAGAIDTSVPTPSSKEYK